MLKTFIDVVVESCVAPRKGFRRVLSYVSGFEAVALIYALSFCLQAILLIVAEQVFATGGAGSNAGSLVASIFFSAISFAIVVALVFWVGRALGGKGSLLDCATAIAWHSLVTVIFAPIISFALLAETGSESAALVLMQLVAMVVILWLMASYVAEAHGFQSTIRVAFTMLAMVFLFGIVLSFLLIGTMSAP